MTDRRQPTRVTQFRDRVRVFWCQEFIERRTREAQRPSEMRVAPDGDRAALHATTQRLLGDAQVRRSFRRGEVRLAREIDSGHADTTSTYSNTSSTGNPKTAAMSIAFSKDGSA